MTAQPAAALQQIFAEEAGLIGQFVDLLQQEQASLGSGAVEDLPGFVERKTVLVDQLNRLARQRNDFFAARGLAGDRHGVDDWCRQQNDGGDAGKQWGRILELATEARELNRINGELIQMRMQFNARALEVLSGAQNSLQLYGPDGQSTKPGPRRINDAV